MKTRHFLSVAILLPLLAAAPLAAQEQPEKKKKEVLFTVPLENALTYERVQGAKAELLRSDSSYIQDVEMSDEMMLNGKESAVALVKLSTSGQYWMRFTKEGYDTLYYSLTARIHPRSVSWQIMPAARIHRQWKPREYQLGEAVVRATKIKMVMRGDTIVYNADAFQLARGSMLDALVERLPGVELRDGGVITVNGRPVESLLLNGRDFFKGEPGVALDNLPAYMVDKVKVYERTTAFDRQMNPTAARRPLVMDVNLKKEFSVGWLANAEAAYGSRDRYLGRLFALGFTPKTHTAVFANLNNTNDTRRPGRRGDWTPAATPTGLQAAKNVGAEFSYEDPKTNNKWTTNVNWLHTDLDRFTRTSQENFLADGKTYSAADADEDHCATSVRLNNDYSFVKNAWGIRGGLNFNYDRNRISATDRQAHLGENPFDHPTAGLLDSLFAPGDPTLLREAVLNRYRQAALSRGKGWGISMPGIEMFFKPFSSSGLSDQFEFTFNGYYNHRDYTAFSHYLLDYPANASIAPDFRNRYNDRSAQEYLYQTSLGYSIYFNGWSVKPVYYYSQSYSSGRDDLYRLDWVEGWGAGDSARLGALPSASTLEQVAHDWANSEHSRRWKKEHTAELNVFMSKSTMKGHYFEFRTALPFKFRYERIDYLRGSLQAGNSRQKLVFTPNFYLMQRYYFKDRKFIQIELNGSHYDAPADMLSLLDYRDDADPLNVRTGNPGLRRTYRENAALKVELFSQQYEPLFTFGLTYDVTSNAVAMNRTFNPATGGYTWRPDNVNGNWNLDTYLRLVRQFGKQKRFSFSSTTSPSYYHSVDLTGIEGQVSSVRSVVDNFHLAQTLQLDYGAERWRLGAKAYANWTYAASDRPGFATINAVDYHFGLTGHVTLPGNIDLDTDFTLYSRRGYDDQGLNTDDFVWNARLSKSILRGNLTFIVDAFDILGQLSNVRRQVNAQGWTETYFNVVPRYVMAHVVYRLNLEPKKGKK